MQNKINPYKVIKEIGIDLSKT